MDAKGQLLEAYSEWRRWTEKESAALARADWKIVSACQLAKENLQVSIGGLSARFDAERSLQAPTAADREEIRSTIAELLAAERSNGAALTDRRRAVLDRQRELHQVKRQLVQVHRCYAPSGPVAWQSYS